MALLETRTVPTIASRPGAEFARLVRAERRRLFSTNGWMILILAAIFLPAVGTVGVGVTLGKAGGIALDNPGAVPQALAAGFSAGLIAAIYGALTVTSEYRYRTISQSAFDAGTRWRWVAAKVPVIVVGGVALTAVGETTTIVLASIFLHRVGVTPDLWHGQLVQMAIGTALLGLPSVLWGAAVGLLVRSQIGAIAGLILYSMVAESAVLQFVPTVGKFLPGGAQAAIVNDPTLPYHHLALGWLIFLSWIVVVGALGFRRLQRSDMPA